MNTYYIMRKEQRLGPFTSEELKGLRLDHDTQVWIEGTAGWLPAAMIAELNGHYIPEAPASKSRFRVAPLIMVLFALLFLAFIAFGYYLFHQNALIEAGNKETLGKIRAKENIRELVKVSHGDFHVGFLGGVSGLIVSVKNSSQYKMDLVLVKVHYIKHNGGVFKTETMEFKNIGGDESMEMSAPDSRRGDKVQCEIDMISSKEIDL